MPLIVDSRGVTTFISDDEARAQAAQLIERIESATRRSEQAGGPLSASAARQVHADFEEAERLLRDTGDYVPGHMGRADKSLRDFAAPGREAEALAQRDQVRREAQTVTRVGALLGLKWSANAELEERGRTKGRTEESADAEQQDDAVVRLKRDQAAGEWVLSGKGPVTRFKNYDLAEAAARRRAGWA